MADEGGDWFADAEDEPPPEPKPLVKKGKGKEKAPEPEPVQAAAPEPEAPPPTAAEEALEEQEFLDPDKLLLCKHWIRPKFLQYKYLFDYRHNYYDDVIDFLDKRQRGLSREIPRPQTWAERALRTYSSQSNRSDYFKALDEDKKLATKMKLTGAFYHYHSREYFNRKYSSIL